jgi:hypothetical protein
VDLKPRSGDTTWFDDHLDFENLDFKEPYGAKKQVVSTCPRETSPKICTPPPRQTREWPPAGGLSDLLDTVLVKPINSAARSGCTWQERAAA